MFDQETLHAVILVSLINKNSKHVLLDGSLSVEVANGTSGRENLNCVIRNCDDEEGD